MNIIETEGGLVRDQNATLYRVRMLRGINEPHEFLYILAPNFVAVVKAAKKEAKARGWLVATFSAAGRTHWQQDGFEKSPAPLKSSV